MKFFLTLFFALILQNISAQTDSLKIIKAEKVSNDTLQGLTSIERNPIRAGLYSTAIPGLGQVYNKKYWKIPIVWGLLTLTGGYFIHHNKRYNRYRDAYLAELDGGTHEFTGILDLNQLANEQDDIRKDRDYMVLLTTVAYLLNIFDAVVDAHLYEIEQDKDLSLQPIFNHINNNSHVGLRLQLKL